MVNIRQDVEFATPKFSLPSLAIICHSSNMSGKHVLQGAQNVVIRGGTSIAAESVREAVRYLLSQANQLIFCADQILH